jgi:hypothetical protein
MPPKTIALGLENAPPLNDAVVLNVIGTAFAADAAKTISPATRAVISEVLRRFFIELLHYPLIERTPKT